jgi:hypothetical protein
MSFSAKHTDIGKVLNEVEYDAANSHTFDTITHDHTSDAEGSVLGAAAVIDAKADDSTKGVATFEADDFDDSSGKIDLADSVVKSVTGDSGTATPSGHSVEIEGGTGITTAGSAAKITVSQTALTASRAVVTGGSGEMAAATTTATEIGYVNGLSSAVQTQLNGKAATNRALDTMGACTDIVTRNSSTSAHGLLKKLDNTATNFMDGQGNWAVPAVTPGEGHITILPWNYNTIGQGTWTLESESDIFGSCFSNLTADANGDNLTFEVYLDAGTYTIRMVAGKDTDCGITDIYIDAAEVASFDWYAGSGAKSQIQTDTSNTVAAAGLKTITVTVDGKNGSSSAHEVHFDSLAFWRTA